MVVRDVPLQAVFFRTRRLAGVMKIKIRFTFMKKNSFFMAEAATILMCHLRICLRRIQKSAKYFFLNIKGFTAGILTVIFICLIFLKELNTDKIYEKGAGIYRLLTHKEGGEVSLGKIPFLPGPLIADKLPEVNILVREINGRDR